MASLDLNQFQTLQEQFKRLSVIAEQRDHDGEYNAYQLLGKDDERFRCLSAHFTDYVKELLTDLEHLKRLATKTDDHDLLRLYADRLCGKYMMLQKCLERLRPTETKKQHVIFWQKQLKKVINNGDLGELYDKLAQQKQFEQRLSEQIDQLIIDLKRSEHIAASAALQEQILELKQRQGRCQKATWQLEQKINHLRSRF
ncbi:primosomal replication protein PriC [Celerinatantimonas sp. YJH-8]|uniref:primosomal replication protein PriC n=1 Tax=Celerinatantimonas sp. YJH-8 TaxID=3228714 RepID=UPI0038CB97F4